MNAAAARPEAEAGETYGITDLAREFDVTTRTIRFYEDQGLLSPRRRGQRRVYAPRDRTRLKLILRGKRLGFSLSEVGEIIALYDTEPGEAGQLEFFLDKIAERRAMLEQQREDIVVTLEELGVVEQRCRDRLGQLGGKRK
jgi:DNA-binding transcriptional MerR regulator